MKKNILIAVALLGSFVLGFFTPKSFFEFQEIIAPERNYEVQVCNNTEIDFELVNLHQGTIYHDIKSGACSNYKKKHELYRYAWMIISTIEDFKTHQYNMTYTDFVGETQLPEGKYTFHINKLDKGSVPTIEYQHSIEYEIVQSNN